MERKTEIKDRWVGARTESQGRPRGGWGDAGLSHSTKRRLFLFYFHTCHTRTDISAR